MSNAFSTFFRWISPEYQSAYRDGYEAGKRAAIREMKKAISRTKEKEPFSEYTVASTTPPTPTDSTR